MAERMDLLARIAEKAGVDEGIAEDVLATLVGELAAPARKEPGGPVVEVPPYFDRYVTAEILHLKEQLSAFRAEVDRRFAELSATVDRRFAEVDRRFGEMDRRFDRLERWFFAFGVPMILGILTIIVKIFFTVP